MGTWSVGIAMRLDVQLAITSGANAIKSEKALLALVADAAAFVLKWELLFMLIALSMQATLNERMATAFNSNSNEMCALAPANSKTACKGSVVWHLRTKRLSIPLTN